jgi:hypothetical protein
MSRVSYRYPLQSGCVLPSSRIPAAASHPDRRAARMPGEAIRALLLFVAQHRERTKARACGESDYPKQQNSGFSSSLRYGTSGHQFCQIRDRAS